MDLLVGSWRGQRWDGFDWVWGWIGNDQNGFCDSGSCADYFLQVAYDVFMFLSILVSLYLLLHIL